MRTLVVSDLHLGSTNDVDVLRRPGAIEPLLAELATIDRLVLLGDTIELRHGPANVVLGRARPVLEQIGAALGDDAQVLILAGNHDHSLFAPYLDYAERPLGLETEIPLSSGSPVAQKLADYLGPRRTKFAYPGAWLRDDVYAMHGHYGDFHTTLPMFERLAAGVMAKLGAHVSDHEAQAEEYERALAPLYAWIDSVAQRTSLSRTRVSSGGGAKLYGMLRAQGPRPLSHRALAVGFPLALKAAVPYLGELSADLSITAVRRSALHATAEVVERLGIGAEHVIFGHTHRAGPFERDVSDEWVTRSGVRLYNSGNWVLERHFMPSPHVQNPYWPGAAIVLGGEGPPRLVRLLDDFVPSPPDYN